MIDDKNKDRLLKEELEKIHNLEKEVLEIEKMQKQDKANEFKVTHDANHEKAKRAITHGEPDLGWGSAAKLKVLIITALVVIALMGIVVIPTKTIQSIDAVTYTDLEPYNTTETSLVNQSKTTEDKVNFRFETSVRVVPSTAGNREEFVLWEIDIKNFENETGCWQYDYDIVVGGKAFDKGTIKNMCVGPKTDKIFTTPLYDLGSVTEKITYSMNLKPVIVPSRTITLISNGGITTLSNVTKYRNVTRVKNETINHSVNWLFGFSIY
jgi:hypothetical protein